MMHDIKLRKALTAGCGFLGLALLLAGFVGGKIAADGVELPQGALSAFLTSCPQALLVAGCAMALVSLFFGNMLLHGGFYPRTYLPYLIIIPAFAFIVLFVLYPMIEIVYLSLFKGNLINPTKTFVGLKNYNDIFFVKNDFKAALGNTAVYTVAVVVFLIFFAVLFALWFFSGPENQPLFTNDDFFSLSHRLGLYGFHLGMDYEQTGLWPVQYLAQSLWRRANEVAGILRNGHAMHYFCRNMEKPWLLCADHPGGAQIHSSGNL